MDTQPNREGKPVLKLLRRLLGRNVDPRDRFRAAEVVLREQFRAAAAARGLPRGLLWNACEANGDVVFVRDRTAGGDWVALLPVLVRFEPLAAMADVSAAREPRAAIAVLRLVRGRWTPDQTGIFNLSVSQIIEKSDGRYQAAHEEC